MKIQRYRVAYRADRRRTVASLLGEARRDPRWAALDAGARLTYVLGALICDSRGAFTVPQLVEAFKDPELIAYATGVLAESGDPW